MKLKKTIILIALMAIFVAAFGFQRSSDPKVLFEKAKFTMETKGDLKGAIKLFEKIIQKYPDEREYAAKSQLYIGLCYEKQGKQEAQKAYEQVIQEYGDQQEVVAEARARLAALEYAVAPVAAKGMMVRQVWAGPDVDVSGGLSPDGRYLSYVDWATGDLAVRDLTTGEKRRLTNKGSWFESTEFALHSVISPDSRHIAYAWYDKDDFFDLRVIRLDGSDEPRILYRNPKVAYVEPRDWSADGKSILAVFSKEAETEIAQIVLVSLEDGSVQVLKTLDWRWPHGLSLSPNGRYVAYDFPPRENTPQRDIFLLATNGSGLTSLVQHPADDFLLGWAPDGKSLLFASNRTGTMDCWVIHVVQGKSSGLPELVKKDIGRVWPQGFTRNGSFYYGLQTGMMDVYMAKMDLATGKLLVPVKSVSERFVGSNAYPNWSPDGQSLAYVSSRGESNAPGSKTLVIRSVQTGEERELPLRRLQSFRLTRWWPDGRFILGIGTEKQRRAIYRIDVQSGEISLLVQPEPDTTLQYTDCTPDGKTIFYDRSVRILRRDLTTGEEKEVYKTAESAHIEGLALSPDGQQLALYTWKKKWSVLKVMPAVGGEARELLSLQQPELMYGNLEWTPDGARLLFGKLGSVKEPEKVELWSIPAAGGKPQKLGLTMARLGHFRVHPDGRRIAFRAGERKAEIWIMENFLPGFEAEKK